MVLPLSDSPNPHGVPVVNYTLIALNVVVFVLVTLPLAAAPASVGDPAAAAYIEALRGTVPDGMIEQLLRHLTQYDLYVFSHGFRPSAPEVSDLFTAMFLHGGFMHLAGNMLFLWIYGDNVERHLGPVRYVAWYLVTGIAATALHYALAPSSPIPTVGASGAISGVLGFYFLWFPRNSIRLLALFPPFLMRTFEVSARMVLGFYLVADNILPLVINGASATGVAHGAHIGGFVAGMAAAWMLDRRDLSGRTQLGDIVDDEHPLRIAEDLRARGDSRGAQLALKRALLTTPRGDERARLHVQLGMILLEDLADGPSAYQQFMAALDADPDDDTAAVARAGITAVRGQQKFAIGQPYRPRRAH